MLSKQAFVTGSLIIVTGLLAITLVGVRARSGAANGRNSDTRASQVDTPPVQVIVTKLIPEPGRYVYRYNVVNGSAFPITDVLIGTSDKTGVHELTYAPMGWDTATTYKSPPGWDFRVVTTEEDTLGHIHWEISSPGERILGGSSLSGFEVTLDEVDQAYENGHWTVFLNTTEEPLYTGGLQPSGITAVPTSSVFGRSDLLVSPNPAKGQVGIQFRVSSAGVTTVDLFDAQGRLVRRLLNARLPSGGGSASWDGLNEAGKRVAAGVYFVRVKTPSSVRFARITRVK